MSGYSAAERHVETMQLLQDKGHASVSYLSDRFSVSEVTIRKDLRELEQRHLLVRTHGGAVLIDHYMHDLPFDEKAQHRAEEKRRIGRAAADLVKDHDTLVLTTGSTTVQVARHLRGKRQLTVTTSSLHVALELMNNLDVDLILLGGFVRPTTASVVGPHAEQMLREHSFRWLFLGGDGLDVNYGMTTINGLEAHLNRLMTEAAQQTVLVVDASKFGRRCLSRVCNIEEIDTVITDDAAPEEAVRQLEDAGVEVIVV